MNSRIQPRIEELIITPIQLAKGLGFVFTIPKRSREHRINRQTKNTTSARTSNVFRWRTTKYVTRSDARLRLNCS